MSRTLTADSRYGISTRAHLSLLALVLIIPVLIFITILLHRQTELQRSRIEQDLLKESRTITATIERDLRGVTAMLETLALMPALQQNDFATFHQQASQINGAAWDRHRPDRS
jgi:sensor domain CHASE-containing protein